MVSSVETNTWETYMTPNKNPLTEAMIHFVLTGDLVFMF